MKLKSPEQIALEKAVKKERKRVQQFVRRARKRGYTFADNVVPNLPKTITEATLSRFQKLTPKYLYRKAVYTSPTGTKVTGTERRTEERKEAAEKAKQTRERFYKQKQNSDYTASYIPADSATVILQNLIDMFEHWKPQSNWSEELKALKTRDRNRGYGIIKGAISTLGWKTVAKNAESHAEEVIYLAGRILYESGNKYRDDARAGEIDNSLNRLSAILFNRPLSISESMEFTAQAEQTEGIEVPS